MWSAVSALSASVDLVVTLVALIGFFLMLMTGRLSDPGEGLVAVVEAPEHGVPRSLRRI